MAEWRPRPLWRRGPGPDDPIVSELAAISAQVVGSWAPVSQAAAQVLCGSELERAGLDHRTGRLELVCPHGVVVVSVADTGSAAQVVAMAAAERVLLHAVERDGWLVVVASSESWCYSFTGLPATAG